MTLKKYLFILGSVLLLNFHIATDALALPPGAVECKPTPTSTGYFTAYFEEVALATLQGYDDRTAIGVKTRGQIRREAACGVLIEISQMLNLEGTHAKPEILFEQNPANAGWPLPSNVLAGASSYFMRGYKSDNGDLYRHIMTGQDPIPGLGNFDAFVITNFYGTLAWDIDSTLNTNTYNFRSIITHELMHALGFRSRLPSVIPTNTTTVPHGSFDSTLYMNEAATQPFLHPMTEYFLGGTGAPPLSYMSNKVTYKGTLNKPGALASGVRPVYSPAGFYPGSSLSHFDMTRSAGEIYIMNPSIGTNTIRPIHTHEKEVLCHLGYAVTGVSGCTTFSPVAIDDTKLLTPSVANCIQPLANDLSLNTGGVLTINSLDLTSIQSGDSVTYYSSNDCTGTVLSAPGGSKSIKLIPAASSFLPRVMTYRALDSVSGRLSLPAIISSVQCNVGSDEYVCNGNFDMVQSGTIPYVAAFACGESWNPSPTTPFWCDMFGTPDLFNFGNSYAAHIWKQRMVNDLVEHGEGVIGELRTPLTVGQAYELSFDVSVFVTDPQTSAANIAALSVKADLNHEPLRKLSNIDAYYFDLQSDQTIVRQTVPLNNPNDPAQTWTNIKQSFIASGPSDYLALRGNVDFKGYSTGQVEFFVDRVSLKKVTAASGTAIIKGTVYKDLNKNALMDGTETGLSEVQVGLFKLGQSAPFMTATTSNLGQYEFKNLPVATYNIALVREKNYAGITQPGLNTTLVTGYTHVSQIVISTAGQVSSGNNFGVSINTIRGIVYFDQNKNGVKDGSEAGIAGVDVGLFSSDILGAIYKTLPAPNLGQFEFNSFPNGKYSIALLNEASYPVITQPGVTNTVLSGYSHPYSVTFQSGETITAKDFGVVFGELDLSVGKSVDKSTLDQGYVTYTVQLSNLSGKAFHNIIAEDILPAEVAYVSHTITGGTSPTYTPSNGKITVATLNTGEVTTLTVKANVTACGIYITNRATYISSTEVDTNTSNNTSSVYFVKPCSDIDVSVAKTVDTSTLAQGFVTYTVQVSNVSPGTAQTVLVKDLLPTGLTYVSHTITGGLNPIYTPSTGAITISALSPVQTTILKVKANVTGCGTITNTATFMSAAQTDTNSVNNSSSVSFTKSCSMDISVVSTIDYAQGFIFVVNLTNVSGTAAHNVVVKDILSAGITYSSHTISGGTSPTYTPATGVINIATLNPGEVTTLRIRVTTTGCGTFTNTATFISATEPDTNAANNSSSESFSQNFKCVADLSIVKTVDTSTLAQGYVTYMIKFTNAGPTVAPWIGASDVLPSGLAYVSHTITGGTSPTFTPSTGAIFIASLNIGEVSTLTIKANVTACGTYTNTVTWTYASFTDPNWANNTSSVAFTKFCPVDISVAKTVDTSTLAQGFVNYTIKVSNSTNGARNVVVRDILPAGTSYVSHTISGGTSPAYTPSTGAINIATLNAGDVTTLIIKANVTTCGTNITNTALFESAIEPDNNTANNSSSVSLTKSCDLVPPTTPGEPGAPHLNIGNIIINWSASTDVGTGIDYYEIYRSSNDGVSFILIGTSTKNQYTDTGLTPGEYVYKVRCKDKAGNFSAFSHDSDPFVKT